MIKKFIKGDRGASTAVTIIGIFVAAMIMFVGPLMIMASKQDKAAMLEAEKVVKEAVAEWANKAVITQEDIDNVQLELDAIGQAYGLEIEIRMLDENMLKKVEDAVKNSGIYITEYTTNVEEKLKSGPIYLNTGDTVTAIAIPIGNSIGDSFSLTKLDNGKVQASATVSQSAN